VNFFEHQERARSKSLLLIFLFVLAVAGVVLAVTGASMAIFNLYVSIKPRSVLNDIYELLPVIVGSVTLAGILITTLVTILKLSRGGAALAEMVGAQMVMTETESGDERRLRNVVEEMAIASGSRVPDIFIFPHDYSVNAMSAGLDPSQAAIIVTKGAITKLTRDELQGLVAHEFSHIFNGDMRLNYRLLGAISGITAIGALGLGLMRGSAHVDSTRTRSSMGGALDDVRLFLVGVALAAIGYIGVLFGRMIQSAVTREREYLADASAVQFTRHPESVAGALKKTLIYGSTVLSSRTDQFNHMLFVTGFGREGSLLSSHPRVEHRIQRIFPDFDQETFIALARAEGKFEKVRSADEVFEELAEKAKKPKRESPPPLPLVAQPVVWEIADRVGQITAESLEVASQITHNIPDDLTQKLRNPPGAKNVVLALLIDKESRHRQMQLQVLDLETATVVETLAKRLETLDSKYRLVLLDLALPAVKTLKPSEKSEFLKHLRQIAQADNHLSLFEYCYVTIVERQLRTQRLQFFRHPRLDVLKKDADLVLGALESCAKPDVTPAFNGPLLSMSLSRLSELPPAEKEKFFAACLQKAQADAKITVSENELLRAFSEVLDCPFPRQSDYV